MLLPSHWPPCFRPLTSPAWSNAAVSQLLSLPSCHPPEWHFLTEKINHVTHALKTLQNRWFSTPVQLPLLSPFPQILITWNDLLFLNRSSVSILQAFSHANPAHPCLENPSSSSYMRFSKCLLFLHLLPTAPVILKSLAFLSIILHWPPWIVTVFSFCL